MELFSYDSPVAETRRPQRGFEAVEVGMRFEAPATATVSEAQITGFAEQFDPQPLHLDAGAAHPLFTPPIASGAHLLAICHRMAVDACFAELGLIGGVGIDRLRWYAPLEPGMTVETTVEVTSRRRSATREGRGYVTVEVTGRTQADPPETLIEYTTTGVVETDTA
ncbi:MAG: MaoC/PaaZ C-terminal domain-containing protein [Haloquadratum sp.]|jgi:acyl dehydratase|nr:MaoC/PaaZ C-terminal domain-containing protein [Haloferacaceae archaeon]MDR9445132.1 MaoC/PaaZ C-terminal domain-containing protein [Haloquadratum sp.]